MAIRCACGRESASEHEAFDHLVAEHGLASVRPPCPTGAEAQAQGGRNRAQA